MTKNLAELTFKSPSAMTHNIGLIILDGWGIGDGSTSDAIYNAHTPYMDDLIRSYPNATLQTSGENVGLPKGQMGNSEVGHLNIGAGRIVYQELTRINKEINSGAFFENKLLKKAFREAKHNAGNLHFIGLLSNGGVHSSQEHLYALCKMAEDAGVDNTYIHAFTDGRDCDPKSGLEFIQALEDRIKGTGIRIASIIGRYFAMDRDNRWDRIKKSYDLLVNGIGQSFSSATEAIKSSYNEEITDEFIEPAVINERGNTIGTIKDGDVVICFNFRTDRPREISIALTQKDLPEHNMSKMDISYYTMTNYDSTFENINVIFEKQNLVLTLGEVLANNGKTQVRIAETEKYPHVTFFFSGGKESPFNNERRILVNSPKVATYDLKPEMSAPEVRDKIVNDINENTANFICLNFANPDMVGHTGIYRAIKKAVETVDECLRDVVEEGLKKGYEFLVIADHGNADNTINADGSPNTTHSLNPVPIILVSNNGNTRLENGILADVAPTILDRLNLPIPEEMTGKSLVRN